MMTSVKRLIAAFIVCFKPHIFLTICILAIILHTIKEALYRGIGSNWHNDNPSDTTITMTTIALLVVLIWSSFFIFMCRFELRNEQESLLILFQCSKHGFRFLGVVLFHLAFLAAVILIVSTLVNRSVRPARQKEFNSAINLYSRLDRRHQSLSDTDARGPTKASDQMHHVTQLPGRHFRYNLMDFDAVDHRVEEDVNSHVNHKNNIRNPSTTHGPNRDYLSTVYKIWLTAIVYCFFYLIIENAVMFNTGMCLIEFVHTIFLNVVAKTTGIDLSDYPAGEMPFNPLVRRRIAYF